MSLAHNTINLHFLNPSNLVFKIKSNTKRKIDFDNNSISQSNSLFLNRLITSLKISFENPYTTYELSKVASSINLTTIELSRPHITTLFFYTLTIHRLFHIITTSMTLQILFILFKQY